MPRSSRAARVPRVIRTKARTSTSAIQPLVSPAETVSTTEPVRVAAPAGLILAGTKPGIEPVPEAPLSPVQESRSVEAVMAELGLRVPPILLEGDEPALAPPAGPGHKFALGPTPATETAPAEEEELLEAYGTGRLFLVARDPHCLYAHWDLTLEQQERYNGLSAHRHLVVRVFLERHDGAAVSELHVHPESHHWFIHVEQAGRTYIAELGYYQAEGLWKTVAVSAPVQTPQLGPSESGEVRFATFSVDPPVAPADSPSPQPILTPLASQPIEALAPPFPTLTPPTSTEFHAEPSLPSAGPDVQPEWSPAQERALEELIARSVMRQEWIGSMEIAELLRRSDLREIPIEASSPGLPSAIGSIFSPPSPTVSSPAASLEISSPQGGERRRPTGFWLNVNAELVIYGATEPDAEVTLGGRRIRLRPDGTFSFRFALPDGEYRLPVAATSAEGDQRQAELKFYRGTRYAGEVGAHPQDPALKFPSPENAS